MADTKDVVAVERVIDAPPEQIFDLLADPARHRDIDGSGTVRDARAGTERLSLGSKFGMSMKMGAPYSMVNTVVEFEENRIIAWQTRPPGKIGSKFAGRIWRYELQPVDGGTKVTESWDIRQEQMFTRPIVRLAAKKTRDNMAATLERIDKLLTK